MQPKEYDLIAIGGGTAGLVSAAGAAYLGVRAALVEKAALGGDCLWTGCVPSKALLASARLAHAMRNADELGLVSASPAHAFASVMARMREARGVIEHHDDPPRLRDMGITVEAVTAPSPRRRAPRARRRRRGERGRGGGAPGGRVLGQERRRRTSSGKGRGASLWGWPVSVWALRHTGAR